MACNYGAPLPKFIIDTQNVAIWVLPKIGVPQNGWFIMENPIKWMIWGYHSFFWKHPFLKLEIPFPRPIIFGILGFAWERCERREVPKIVSQMVVFHGDEMVQSIN